MKHACMPRREERANSMPTTKKRASKVNDYQLSLFDLKPQSKQSKLRKRPIKVDDFPEAEKQCLDKKTEILTRTGWVKMDEMTYDHEVSNWHKDGTITFTKPSFILVRDRKPDEQMVVLETQRRSIRVVGTRPIAVRTYCNKNFASHRSLDVINLRGGVLIPVWTSVS
jgi:hypothetical protein